MTEKILLHVAASQLASAVAQNLPDNLPIDHEIKDGTLRAQNLMVWELHRIFYHALVGTLGDSSWPSPPTTQPLTTDRLLPLIKAALAEPGGSALLTELRSLLTSQSSSGSGSTLPNPGGGSKNPTGGHQE